MKTPEWNVWTVLVAIVMFATGVYLMKIQQAEIGALVLMAAMTFAGVTQKRQP